MKNKKELFTKLSKLKISDLERLNLEKEEIEYVKTKLLNDNIGLTLNFKEMSESLMHNYMVLEEDKELGINVKDNEKNNLLIEGDNYYALKALKSAGVKVDVIYIDPPYNTGKEFSYNDDFSNKPKVVGPDDPHKHSKWLSFMKKRLKLAKNLLSNEGVIFVSIDDNEQAYLKVLMDEIFGESNFVNQLVWVSNKKGRQISNSAFAKTYEYILLYSKMQIREFKYAKFDRYSAEKLMPSIYQPKKLEIFKDDIGEFIVQNELHNTNINAFNVNTRKNLYFPIYTDGKNISIIKKHKWLKLLPPKNTNGVQGVWRWSRKKVASESCNLYIKKINNKYKIYTKIRDIVYTPKDIIISSKMTTKSGGNYLSKLSIEEFSFPKPVLLINFLINMISKKDSIILDFFAGSGTTGHAVMELNKEDGGNRKFILVTNNEMRDVDTEKEPEKGIARAITRERLFRVINGKGSNNEPIKWEYSKDEKSLKDNSVAYLKVKPINKVKGDFEEIDFIKKLYKREFNKDINIIDLQNQENDE